MASRYEIHYGITSSSGGGPASGPDRFAPKYLVGNIPNGDSATATSLDGFTYIPDAGDGNGIASAIAAAGVTRGDIWIRPGVYDLSQPTSPIAAFTIPQGVTVRGSGGWGIPPVYATLIVGRTTGDLRVFLCQDFGSNIEGLAIQTNFPQGSVVTGNALVSCSGNATVNIRDVRVVCSFPDLTAAPPACIAVSGSSSIVSIDRCQLISNIAVGTNLGSAGTSCLAVYGGRTRVTRSNLAGGDYVVAVYGGTPFSGTSRVFVTSTLLEGGAWASVYCPGAYPSEVSLVSDTEIVNKAVTPGFVGVYAPVAANQLPILSLRCTMDIPSGYGVLAACKQSRITSSRIVADTGIDTSAGSNNIIVGNVVDAAPGQQILPSGTDEVAHNILL